MDFVDILFLFADVPDIENEMTRIALRIEHKHLPAASDFNVEPISSEEISGAIASLSMCFLRLLVTIR